MMNPAVSYEFKEKLPDFFAGKNHGIRSNFPIDIPRIPCYIMNIMITRT